MTSNPPKTHLLETPLHPESHSTPPRTFATIISIVLGTPFTAAYGLLILIFFWPNAFSPVDIITGFTIAFVFLIVVPLYPIVHSYIIGRTDLFVTDKTKRWPLFTIAIISQVIGAWISFVFGSAILTLYHLCYTTTTVTTAFINTKTKISVHIAGLAGPITFLVFFLGPIHVLWWLVVFPVAWSRLKLNAHTPFQLGLGFFTAVIVTIGTLFLGVPLFS